MDHVVSMVIAEKILEAIRLPESRLQIAVNIRRTDFILKMPQSAELRAIVAPNELYELAKRNGHKSPNESGGQTHVDLPYAMRAPLCMSDWVALTPSSGFIRTVSIVEAVQNRTEPPPAYIQSVTTRSAI
jgi:hypothetical protein